MLSLSGCAAEDGENYVCIQDRSTFYPNVLEKILPNYETKPSYDKVYANVERGYASEAFEMQAFPAIEHGIAKYWYPQYLATAVIAVDRDRTSVEINGWNDLLNINENISLCYGSFDESGIINAISYALEGQNFTYNSAVKILEPIHESGRLKFNTFEPPVLICYDYQAAYLAKNGANIEIIVPSEGTLSYSTVLSFKKTD